jgi:hypothetical protein
MPNPLRRLLAIYRRHQAHTHCARILRILERHPGEWVGNLYGRGTGMVHSRVAELRRKGYRIECRCFGRGDYRYRLEVEG